MDIGLHPVIAILAAIGLAACAGLRAFLPILVVGLSARFLGWPLTPALEWMTTDLALALFGLATLVEIAADKIPLVDNVLDAAHTVIGPLAGILVAFAPLAEIPTPLAAAIAIATGASVAGGVHAIAALSRVQSTAATGGIGNPVLSVIEDGLALFLSLLAVLAPLLILAVLIGSGVLIARLFSRRSPA